MHCWSIIIRDDATVLTIEPGKLGINRGASSLTQALEVNGGAWISGNVGIGNTNPQGRLHLNDSGTAIPTSGYGTGLMVSRTDGLMGTMFGFLNSPQSGYLQVANFTNTDTLPFLINPRGGNVGIGTDSPTSIQGFAKVLKVEDASNASIVVSGGVHEAEYAVSSSGGWFGTATNIPQRFITNNTQRMTLDADGRLGLGEQQHASAGHRTIEGRVDIRMNQAGVNWTDGNYSEIWDSAGTPGSKFNDTMLHIDTNRNGGSTGGVVGIAFSPGWQGHQNWGIVATNKTGGSYSQGDLSFVSQLNDGSIHERMRLSGAGNVGIGVSDPDSKLEIKGAGGALGLTLKTTDASSNETFYVQDGGGVGVRYYPLKVGIPSGTATATNAVFQVEEAGLLTVLTTGKVGIGTTAPNNKLQIGDVGSTNYGGNEFVIGDGTRVFATYMNATSDAVEFYTNRKFAFLTSGSGATGNVGIGYASPDVRLEVNGGADGSVVFGGRSDGGNGNNRRFNLIAYADGGGANYGGGLKIQTRSSTNVFADAIKVQSNGKVTFVASSIDLNNSGTYAISSQTSGTVIRGAQVRFLDSIDHRTPTQGSMTHGNMGFGFTSYALNNNSPWADIIYLNSYTDASGGSPNAIVVSRSGSNAKIVRYPWSSTSSTVISGGTQYGLDSASASDERLKENVNDITDGLAVINRLRPVTFNWTDTYIESGSSKNEEELEVNSDTDQDIKMPSSKVENVGLIAQEVEAVVPTVVHEGQISIGGVDYKNVDYKKLVPHLIAAIQEQQALITSLTARVTTLEG